MARLPRISRDKVVEVAIRILDEEGLSALSLERIAGEIGVRAPSLYHYYGDKSEILDDVAQRILGRLTLEIQSDDWEEWLVANVLELYRRVMMHPNVAFLVLEHMSPRAIIAGFGRAAALVERGGVPRERSLLVLEGVHYICWGFVMHRTILSVHPSLEAPPDPGRWPALAALRREDRLSDVERLEATVRAFIAGVASSPR